MLHFEMYLNLSSSPTRNKSSSIKADLRNRGLNRHITQIKWLLKALLYENRDIGLYSIATNFVKQVIHDLQRIGCLKNWKIAVWECCVHIKRSYCTTSQPQKSGTMETTVVAYFKESECVEPLLIFVMWISLWMLKPMNIGRTQIYYKWNWEKTTLRSIHPFQEWFEAVGVEGATASRLLTQFQIDTLRIFIFICRKATFTRLVRRWIDKLRCILLNMALCCDDYAGSRRLRRGGKLCLDKKGFWMPLPLASGMVLYSRRGFRMPLPFASGMVLYWSRRVVEKSFVQMYRENNRTKLLRVARIVVVPKMSACMCSKPADSELIQFMAFRKTWDKVFRAQGCMCARWNTNDEVCQTFELKADS